MKRTAIALLSGLLAVLGSWVLAGPASACSCVPEDVEQQFQQADAVFLGTLLSRTVAGGTSSGDPALHVFTVDMALKGAVAAQQEVVSAASGASCGLELSGQGPFVVFATRSADLPAGQYAADLCGGSGPATPELVAAVRARAGPPGSAGPTVVPNATPAVVPAAAAAPARSAGGSATPWVLGAGGVVLALLAVVLVRRRGRAGS